MSTTMFSVVEKKWDAEKLPILKKKPKKKPKILQISVMLKKSCKILTKNTQTNRIPLNKNPKVNNLLKTCKIPKNSQNLELSKAIRKIGKIRIQVKTLKIPLTPKFSINLKKLKFLKKFRSSKIQKNLKKLWELLKAIPKIL